ncbi:MAG: hypothetical protein KDN18_15830 [Verrucomicrobiae bacterium]|nr:hypothetical protein [Verrucomicrobiae bacterium]
MNPNRSLSLLTAILSLLVTACLHADSPFLWGVTGTAGAASKLYAINPNTGKAIEVGPVGKKNVSGISVHPVSGVLYAMQGQRGGTTSLLILNKRTGKTTTIGDLGQSIADSAFTPAGTLYAYGAFSRDLFTVNLTNAMKTTVKLDVAVIGGCGITFDGTGDLFMTRSNSLANLNPMNGNEDSVAVISGATTNIDNLLTTRPDGVIFGGKRNNQAAPTRLYQINPTTGVTSLVSSVPLSLSGLSFDMAPKPVFRISGPKTKRTSRTTYRLRGIYKSIAPCTIKAKKAETMETEGSWSLSVSRLKPGTNRIKVVCQDAAGAKVTRPVRIIVE